jgi:hypothetical protein
MKKLFVFCSIIAIASVVGCQPAVQPAAQPQPNINIQMDRPRPTAPAAPQYVPVVPVVPVRPAAPAPAPCQPPSKGGGIRLNGGIGIDIDKK